LPNIILGDDLGGDAPGTRHPVARESFEVKLAANFGVRATSMGHIVAVEWHHVS